MISQTNPCSLLYGGLSERKTVLVRSELRPHQPGGLGVLAVGILWADLVDFGHEMDQMEYGSAGACDPGTETTRPSVPCGPSAWNIPGAITNGRRTDTSPARVRQPGSIRNRSGICAFSFSMQLGRRHAAQSAVAAKHGHAAMSQAILEKTSFSWRETSISLAVIAALQPLASKKGPRAYSPNPVFAQSDLSY